MTPRSVINDILKHCGYELARLRRTTDYRRQHLAILPHGQVDVILDVGANIGSRSSDTGSCTRGQ